MAPPYPPEREQAALAIARARQIAARPVAGGRWIPVNERGEAMTAVDHADVVEALEAAEAAIGAGELREAQVRTRRLFGALERGLYGLVPRRIAAGPAAGSIEWLILDATTRQPVGQPWPGLQAALVEVARLVAEPAPVEPERPGRSSR